jgi:hypothetical protein
VASTESLDRKASVVVGVVKLGIASRCIRACCGLQGESRDFDVVLDRKRANVLGERARAYLWVLLEGIAASDVSSFER